jgi:hypothetical protein
MGTLARVCGRLPRGCRRCLRDVRNKRVSSGATINREARRLKQQQQQHRCRVEQSGQLASFISWRPRVQIPPLLLSLCRHPTSDRLDTVNIRKLNFSQFHPLDHYPFEKRCWEFYGGPVTHIQYGWQFKWKSDIRAHTRCRIGWHKWTTWRRRVHPGVPRSESDEWISYIACGDCMKKRA